MIDYSKHKMKEDRSLTLRLNTKDLEDLKKIAEREKMSVAAVVRAAIQRLVEEDGNARG